MDLGIHYLDVEDTTDNLTFTVMNEDNETLSTMIASSENDWNVSYPVLSTEQGKAYIWTIRANNTLYKNDIVQSNVIRFGYDEGFIPFSVSPQWNQWIALGVIFLVAVLFGRATIKYASAIIVLLALFFAVIGWLSYAPLLIATIVFLGVLFYIRYAEQESDT